MTPAEIQRRICKDSSELLNIIADLETKLRRARRSLLIERVDRRPGQPVGPVEVLPLPQYGYRERAVKEALAIWQKGVAEPPGQNWDYIDTFIRGDRGLHWTWEEPYERDGQFAWCGAFAAFVFGGEGLLHEIRHNHMASCYRLQGWAEDHGRLVKPSGIKRGDIAVVGPADAPDYGNHITICTGRTNAALMTVEGNAVGKAPNGRWEGVITKCRPFESSDDDEYRVMYGVRFLAEDFGLEEG